MMRGRAVKGDGIVRWLLPAAALHAVAVSLGVALFSAAPWHQGAAGAKPAAPVRAAEPESILELILLDDTRGGKGVEVAPAPLARLEAARTPDARPSTAAIELPRPGAARDGKPSQPPGATPAADEERATSVSSPLVPGQEAPAGSAASSEPRPQAAPTLSLAQLGVGDNPFLSIAIEPPSEAERANQRLQAALHPFEGSRDHQLGRGPERPVVDAARSLVLAEDILVETSAVLNVRVDGGGHVTEVHLLDATSQNKDWQRIAARLARALGPMTLRGDGAKHGWDLKLRLASSVQLPSGAAPGFRMGVLGQHVAGSGGPNSTGLELSPTAKLDLPEAIDSVGRHLDQPLIMEVMLLKLKADLTDIGAPARRLVEVAVLSIDAAAEP